MSAYGDSCIKAIKEGLRELLETKFLYQKIDVGTDGIQAALEIESERGASKMVFQTSKQAPEMPDSEGVERELRAKANQHQKDRQRLTIEHGLESFKNSTWHFDMPQEFTQLRLISREYSDNYEFVCADAPTVKTSCSQCGGIWPHDLIKPPALKTEDGADGGEFLNEYFERGNQVFRLPYRCQSCKGDPLVFLVARQGLSLRLVGRSQFQEVDVPRQIPVQEAKHLRNALIASQTGFDLAALFYLRTFIEQYLRRVTGVSADERLRGDELAGRYRALLDPDFPQRLDTFGEDYDDLSARLHAAKEDPELISSVSDRITKHFIQLELLPLQEASS